MWCMLSHPGKEIPDSWAIMQLWVSWDCTSHVDELETGSAFYTALYLFVLHLLSFCHWVGCLNVMHKNKMHNLCALTLWLSVDIFTLLLICQQKSLIPTWTCESVFVQGKQTCWKESLSSSEVLFKLFVFSFFSVVSLICWKILLTHSFLFVCFLDWKITKTRLSAFTNHSHLYWVYWYRLDD